MNDPRLHDKSKAYYERATVPIGFGDWFAQVYLPAQEERLLALESALADTALAYAEARTAKTEWQKANQPEFDSETPEELEAAISHTHVCMMIVAGELMEERGKQ